MTTIRSLPPAMADRIKDLDPVAGQPPVSADDREAALARILVNATVPDVRQTASVTAPWVPRHRRAWLPLGAAGAVVAIILAASVLGSHQGQPAKPRAPELTGRLVLDWSTVRAGTPIKGALLVTNHGDRAINLNTRCRPNFYVVLTHGGRPPEELPSRGICSHAPLIVKPGQNRLPLAVFTTYSACSPEPQGAMPRCLAIGMPPLPPGRYTAVLVGAGELRLPAPAPVPVLLTPIPKPENGCLGTIRVAATGRPPQILAHQDLIDLTVKVGDVVTVSASGSCGAAVTVTAQNPAVLAGDRTGHRFTVQRVGISRLMVTHGMCAGVANVACYGGIAIDGAVDVTAAAQ